MTDLTNPTPLWLRIAQFAPIRLAVLGMLILECLAFANTFLEQNMAVPIQEIMAIAGMVAMAMWIYVGFAHYIERREPSDLALGQMPRELGLGLVLGTALYTCSVLILIAIGAMRIDGVNPPSFMIPAIAMALSSGFLEELLFRGVLFRIVEQWLGSWVSVIISSAVFGIVHLMNPAATMTGAIFISIEAGVLLAAAYMLTRRLWLGIGFHISWNYTQSAVFSGVVSGSVADPGLFKTVMTGPDLLTGGSFGLEASLVACVVCTTAGVILVLKAVRRGHVVQPSWSRAQPKIGASAG